MRFTFKFDSRKFEDTAKKFTTGVQNFTPMLQNLIPLIEAEKEKQFDAQGGRLNRGKWAPLAPSTVRQKGSTTILQRTGKMRRGFSGVVLNNGTTLVYSNKNTKYYKFHQLGTRKMPQRKILGMTNVLRAPIEKSFKAYIDSLLR